MRPYVAVLLLLVSSVPCRAAQQEPAPTPVPDAVAADVTALRQLAQEDRTAIDAIVMYPENLRNAIFEISAQTELLARVGRMHRTAAASFQRIVSCLTPAEQRMAYDIARYPGLAGDLIAVSGSPGDFQRILIDYPTAIHSAAMALATRRQPCDVLANVNSLQDGMDGAYQSLIAGYPKEAAAAMELLLTQPEILELLLDNMDQSVLIGSIYRKDPEFVRKRAAEIGKTVSEKSEKAEQDWKAILGLHPMATGDLTQAAAAFAAAKGRDINSRNTGTLLPPSYSFWFGYPPGASWYSYPDYFQWGFYYDVDGSVMIVSLPSKVFIEWLDPKTYPQLASVIAKFYRAHPGMTGGFYAAVRERIESMKEAPEPPVSETARNLAEGLKLASPTDIELNYKAGDYWMSTNYQAIKQGGGIGGIQPQ